MTRAGFQWVYRGRAWVFGDNVGVDGDLMPLEFALRRETDPQVLKGHLFAGLDPEFPGRARPGDIVVAGRRFAQGNPHIQGLLGLAGAGLGLVARSIPSGSYRNAINAGVPFLLDPAGETAGIKSGDLLEVDFRSGALHALNGGCRLRLVALPPSLQGIIERGGWRAHFADRLRARDPKPGPTPHSPPVE